MLISRFSTFPPSDLCTRYASGMHEACQDVSLAKDDKHTWNLLESTVTECAKNDHAPSFSSGSDFCKSFL